MTKDIAVFIILGLVSISLVLLCIILIQKYINYQTASKKSYARDMFFKKYFDQKETQIRLSSRFFFEAFIDIETQVQTDPEIRKTVINDLIQTRFCKKQFKNIHKNSVIKRKLAIFFISHLKTDDAYVSLELRLEKENNETVRFYLIYALMEQMNSKRFSLLMRSIKKGHRISNPWYFNLIKNNYAKLKPFLMQYEKDDDSHVKSLFIFLCSHEVDDDLKNYAIQEANSNQNEVHLKLEALSALSQSHPSILIDDIYFNNKNEAVKKIALHAASRIYKLESVKRILNDIDGTHLDINRAQALSKIVYEKKEFLLFLIQYYEESDSQSVKKVISRTLSHHMDYLALKLKNESLKIVHDIIDDMLKLHIIEDFIDFSNQNKDKEIEQHILKILKKHMSQDAFLLEEFSIYLNSEILGKMGLTKKPAPIIAREKTPIERKKVTFILKWVMIAILIFPIIFIGSHVSQIINGTMIWFPNIIIRFNEYLIVYFLSVNSIYLGLMFLSLIGASQRVKLWSIKKKTLLFEHDLLPSISIIAPAYNEEKSIIESITSLLNLKYPKYEVIVVNDGSKDLTVQTLINHFKLERKHPFFKQSLKTKPLKGVYVSKHIPNLIVIDKHNGGKADALNLGINASKYDYVCGIDADSILDEDALLKLMSVTLDDQKQHIALGGNIVPINGSSVDQGKVEFTGLGKKSIVRFQTIEYLRAFTTGRIGWAKLNSLLIISGAFGVFQRVAILKTGGYLTISGDLKKDTVGEDMELVVRLTYEALKENTKYKVDYVHHANCYTELPSDFQSLLKQRNRWQRGLLDILSYHRHLLLHPKYKQPAWIAFPYFFIYEMMGPFIEMIGYICLVIGLVFGLLNQVIVLLMLAVTIGLGMVISLFSLYISERKTPFYSFKDTVKLIVIAVIENFGYRQIMSLHRIISTFSALKESGNWGSQKRQGFKKIS